MSDNFYVRVRSVEDKTVVFDVSPGFTSGVPDECADTPSFALLLLADAGRRGSERRSGEEGRRLDEKWQASPLAKALTQAEEACPDWAIDEDWMLDKLDRFVVECEVDEVRNDLGTEELNRREQAIIDAFGLASSDYARWQGRRWEDCFSYTLRVLVADSQWVEHIEPGLEFGTAAYDVCFD